MSGENLLNYFIKDRRSRPALLVNPRFVSGKPFSVSVVNQLIIKTLTHGKERCKSGKKLRIGAAA